MNQESINDYQLKEIKEYNYSNIFDLLSKNKAYKKDDIINKSYTHSLFTPILSYIIDYLNCKEELKGILGKSIIDEIEIIYIVLNHSIYDLFFKKEKGILFNGANEIDYKIKKENYLIPKNKVDEEEELDINALNKIACSFIGEQNLVGNIKELFEFKKREIISSFKYGYSNQERIMKMLISYGKNNIYELPNLVFYKVNSKKKIYSEVDRIITVNDSIELDKFLIYAKAEFRKSHMKYENFTSGKELKLKKDSCYFIEIKTSINGLIPKDTGENNEFDYVSGASSIHSQSSVKKNLFTNIFYNMKVFLELFNKLNKSFKNIILIIIIDSYFSKNFCNIAEKFAGSLDVSKVDIDFDLYFVHIESDIIYTHDLTEIQKVYNNLTEKENQINKLKSETKESKEKIKKSEEKIKTLEKDATKSEEKIKKLGEELKNLNQKVSEFDRKNKLRKIKKKILKDKALSDCIKEIKLKEKKVLECEIKDKINTENTTKILDAKTFCKIYYKKDYFELIDDIKKKHFKNLDKYSSENKEKQNLILIVDFVFMLSLKEIMGKYFNNQRLKINEANDFFILKFDEAIDQKEFEMSLNIPGYKILDLNKIISMDNFMTYYYEVKEKLDKVKNIKNFCIYDPLVNRNNFYLNIQETNLKSKENSAILLVIDPEIEPEDLNLDIYALICDYIIVLYKTYFFKADNGFLERLFEYFFPNQKFDCIPIKDVDLTIIKETSSKILYKLRDKYFIENKNKNVIETKLKLKQTNSDLNLIINTNSIIDKNINLIINSITFKTNFRINILIEQSCNILYKYLKNVYKQAEFVLLNNDINDNQIKNLKKYISTYEDNEVSKNLSTYITESDNKKFNLIILETVLDSSNLFDNKEILIKIKNLLCERGLFIIHLIADNIYSKNDIYKKLKSTFKEVKILNENKIYELNNVLICSDN